MFVVLFLSVSKVARKILEKFGFRVLNNLDVSPHFELLVQSFLNLRDQLFVFTFELLIFHRHFFHHFVHDFLKVVANEVALLSRFGGNDTFERIHNVRNSATVHCIHILIGQV